MSIYKDCCKHLKKSVDSYSGNGSISKFFAGRKKCDKCGTTVKEIYKLKQRKEELDKVRRDLQGREENARIEREARERRLKEAYERRTREVEENMNRESQRFEESSSRAGKLDRQERG